MPNTQIADELKTETISNGITKITVDPTFAAKDLYLGLIEDERWPGTHAWFTDCEDIFVMFPGQKAWAVCSWEEADEGLPTQFKGSISMAIALVWQQLFVDKQLNG